MLNVLSLAVSPEFRSLLEQGLREEAIKTMEEAISVLEDSVFVLKISDCGVESEEEPRKLDTAQESESSDEDWEEADWNQDNEEMEEDEELNAAFLIQILNLYRAWKELLEVGQLGLVKDLMDKYIADLKAS